jgi:hypothetical protein
MRSAFQVLLSVAEAIFFAVVVTIAAHALYGLTPDRKDPPPPKKTPAPPPFIGGACNWGTLLQDGRKVTITGHGHWEAVGKIRADNRLEVLWTRLSDGALCPGLYRINADGSIKGRWGEGTVGAKIGDDGEIEGPVLYDETVREGK